MNPSGRALAVTLCVLMLTSLAPVVAEHGDPVTVNITVHWMGEGSEANAHAYLLTFGDNGTYVVDVLLDHRRNGSALPASHSLEWGSTGGVRTALVTFNTSLQWGDEIDVVVSVTQHDGVSVEVEAERHLLVGQWNQPMADHEVLLSTAWSLEQAYDNITGPQRFALAFTGQGWQERVGDVLHSSELGNGTFETLESTTDGQTDLALVLTQVWKNETIVAGILTHQVFDARGFGSLETVLVDGQTETVIQADVSQAVLNRSFAEGLIGERLLLEATGSLNVTEEGDDNNSLAIDGDLSVFFFEYVDSGGVRVLQHTQFEAMADFVLVDDGTRLDVSLDGFSSLDRWENGVRTEQLEELYGTGTFGFSDQDENASLQVNGTILDLHTKVEDGVTTIDDLHVDGVLTGDVQGSFGVVRGIETTGMQTNATGEAFLVNVIFQESWFNLTGINGGNFFGGAGLGATHNQTWDYQAVNADWDNRTVRLVWRETGPDASEGEEFPERSPIQQNATAPVSEEGLGDVTVGRETGLMPVPLATNDRLRLNGQEGLSLTINAGERLTETRDGHNLAVIAWNGVYGGTGEAGFASGTLVSVGPLSGLLSEVERNVSLPFGSSNETVMLRETQHLERVLSPEIVSADNNTAPNIGTIELREGVVVGEGGSVAHLEVTVSDAEWNVVEVLVDASSFGAGQLVLNDRGLDGDQSVGDDVYSTTVVVTGLEVGTFPVTVTSTDSFGVTSQREGALTILNQGPRLLSVELAPGELERGQSLVVNARAYDGHGVESVRLDLRSFGGEMVNLTLTDGVWATMVALPSGVSPGDQALTLVVEDTLGASNTFQSYIVGQGDIGDPVLGPHHVNVASLEPIVLRVLNDRPSITTTPTTVTKSLDEPIVYTVEVNDPDGIERVQINLGVYAPVGQTSWVTMHDDGQSGGDTEAGDGLYSVLLSVREGTPLGTHEVTVRSFDVFGEMNSASAAIVLVAEDGGGSPPASSSGWLYTVLGAVLVVGALVVLAMVWRRQEGGGDGHDRFGMQ